MIIKRMYKYELENGGYTISPEKPEKGYQLRWRLIAEEGKAITDGTRTVTVIDVMQQKELDNWRDCDLPEDTAPMLPPNPWEEPGEEQEPEEQESEENPEEPEREGEKR